MPYLEITEVILIHCNVANDGYQQNSRFLYKFVANKSFGQLLIISSKKFMFLKTFVRIFIYWSVVYRSQFSSSKDKR